MNILKNVLIYILGAALALGTFFLVLFLMYEVYMIGFNQVNPFQ